MGKLMTAVEQYLHQQDWTFDRIPGKDAIRFGLKAENGVFSLHFICEEEMEQIILHVGFDQNVPEGNRAAIGEYITRVNYGMTIGNFEMDYEDGDTRYKVSLDVEGGTLSQQMVDNMISVGVNTMDRYFPGIMAVCYAGKDPADAIRDIEGQ